MGLFTNRNSFETYIYVYINIFITCCYLSFCSNSIEENTIHFNEFFVVLYVCLQIKVKKNLSCTKPPGGDTTSCKKEVVQRGVKKAAFPHEQ